MNTYLATFAKTFLSRLDVGRTAWPHGRPGTDARHDSDLRRVLRDLDAFP